MFGRKRPEDEDRRMAETADDLGIPMKPARPVAAPMAVTAVGRATATVPPRVPEMAPRVAPEPTPAVDAPQRRGPEPLRTPLNPPPVPAPPPPPVARRESEARKLTVGREIALSGEI